MTAHGKAAAAAGVGRRGMTKHFNMAGFRDRDKRLFPLNNVASVVRLCASQLQKTGQPDLALLSIVLGAIENLLTCNRPVTNAAADGGGTKAAANVFPVLELKTVEALYCKFVAQIKGSVDLSQYGSWPTASRELVKKVSDVIWGSLTRSYYKDRAHLQTLYSYLTGNKLDCFGVAYAVVAGCQVLGFNDVHLALSEDHVWVTFGKDFKETAEVTWHGKGNEDKRGQPISEGMDEKSWLYINGHPVRCTRAMEVAVLVSGINPSINATSDSIELGILQKELLWLLYDLGHLQMYPVALGNLGELEELSPTEGRPSCLTLFQKAVESSKTHYANQHVYPYTYLGGYYYRNHWYKEALETWACGAGVIRNYNYTREDEEIYKEFLEIANELIPHLMKIVSSKDSQIRVLKDPECFAQLLRFYDGICSWEEGSSTPVLHIGWAKPLVNTIAKFDAHVRTTVDIVVDGAKDETENGNETKKDKEEEETPTDEVDHRDFIKTLETQINPDEELHPNIAALAAACGENILNRDYLLGSGEPFSNRSTCTTTTTMADCREFLSSRSNGTSFPGMTMDSMLKAESPTELLQGHRLLQATTPPATDINASPGSASTFPHSEETVARPKVTLYSEKMKGLKELLLADKLNASAIQLQLTAQSQVQIVKRHRSYREIDFISSGTTRSTKRSRRE